MSVEQKSSFMYGASSNGWVPIKTQTDGSLVIVSSFAIPKGSVNQVHQTGAGLALGPNSQRNYLLIQNVSTTNALLVGFDIDVSNPSNTVAAIILGPASTGGGGSYESPATYVFTGAVYLAGTSPSAVIIEG